jgi:hypothetical protein
MSNPKEPDFFFAQFFKIPTNGIGDNCQDVVQKSDDYFRLFEHAVGKKAVGESSHTNLYYYRKTILLLKQYLGDPKIIIILRNLVERASLTHTAVEGKIARVRFPGFRRRQIHREFFLI